MSKQVMQRALDALEGADAIDTDMAAAIAELRAEIERLDALLTAAKEVQTQVEPTLGERSPEYWVSKFPVPLGYKLVKTSWEPSPPLSQNNPDFILNPVEYQYAYPDGTWRCSNGDTINGMKPTAARALYATRNSS